MKHHFYGHLVEIDSIHAELDMLEMTAAEKQELVIIVESSIHKLVLETVLSKLNEEEKKVFLSHLSNRNHDEIWKLLKTNVKDIEATIKTVVIDLKKELHEDIKKARREAR